MAMDVSADVQNLADEIAARVCVLPRSDTQSLRSLRREYSRMLGDANSALILALGPALAAKAIHRFFADELIANHEGAINLLGAEEVLRLGAGISSWDQVDCFALTSPARPGAAARFPMRWYSPGRRRPTAGGGGQRS